MRVLVIEDNPKMAQAIERGLAERGMSVESVANGQEGRERAERGDFDVVVLDLMLPDVDGLEVCRQLRSRGTPDGQRNSGRDASVQTGPRVLMLTALSSVEHKVAGFEAGADDYLSKPFAFDELAARLRALSRRSLGDDRRSSSGASHARTLTCADLELDPISRTVRRAGRKVDLSPREYALLEYMLRNQGRILTRSAISEHVWEITLEPSSNVVDVYISALRRKIDRGHATTLLHTAKGLGYRLGVEP